MKSTTFRCLAVAAMAVAVALWMLFPEAGALAGVTNDVLGTVPVLATAAAVDLTDIQKAISGFETKVLGRIDDSEKKLQDKIGKLEKDVGAIDADLAEVGKKVNRPKLGKGDGDERPLKAADDAWFDKEAKREIRVLRPDESLAALEVDVEPDDERDGPSLGRKDDGRMHTRDQRTAAPSLGRFLRGIVCGSAAHDARQLAEERKDMGVSDDPSGGYTVGGALAAAWIDALRARMSLVRAGARTVPMDSNTLTMARLLADPTCTWHAENGDVPKAQPSLGAVKLQSKTVVCLVPLSIELAQDAANIEEMLRTCITAAMGLEIDKSGLVGKSTDSAIAPLGIANAKNRSTVTSIGAPTSWDWVVDGMYELLIENVSEDRIGALIAHPAVWKKMRKLKTGITNDNTPLEAPQEVAALPKIWTTAAPLAGGTTATGFIADWSDLLFGVRKQIQIQVLRESFMGSKLQIAFLAYARVDFVMAREQSLCTLEGITV